MRSVASSGDDEPVIRLEGARAATELAPLIDSFLRHVRARNRTQETIVTYKEACSRFAAFVSRRA